MLGILSLYQKDRSKCLCTFEVPAWASRRHPGNQTNGTFSILFFLRYLFISYVSEVRLTFPEKFTNDIASPPVTPNCGRRFSFGGGLGWISGRYAGRGDRHTYRPLSALFAHPRRPSEKFINELTHDALTPLAPTFPRAIIS